MLAPLSFSDYLAKIWVALVLATPGLEDGLHISFPIVHLIDWALLFILAIKRQEKGFGGTVRLLPCALKPDYAFLF